jgi:hypothetical protein
MTDDGTAGAEAGGMAVGAQSETAPAFRRHDIDWLRIAAIGLLILYHAVIGFQPWARDIWFIQNDQTLEWLWIPMSLLNVWRIPLLFVVSGMGLRFALERRDWKQLLADRFLRIFVPLAFGFFVICPITAILFTSRYGGGLVYLPNAGHLWFLVNLFLYVLVLLPFLGFFRKPDGNPALRFLARSFRRPLALFFLAIPPMLEAWILDPEIYWAYAGSLHGLALGLVCFSGGFILASLGPVFWASVVRVRLPALLAAFSLYLVRLLAFGLQHEPAPMVALESSCWLLAVFGFSATFLNRPARHLRYLSEGVYPMYILHMPIQFALSRIVFSLPLPAAIKLLLLLAGVLGLSLAAYECVRRVFWLRPLLGLRPHAKA